MKQASNNCRWVSWYFGGFEYNNNNRVAYKKKRKMDVCVAQKTISDGQSETNSDTYAIAHTIILYA